MKKLLIVILLLFMSGCETSNQLDCKHYENVGGRCLDDDAPVFEGVADKTIEKGTSFDSLDGVTAYDELEGDVTSLINVYGTVDSNENGTYFLRYTVEDESGNEAIIVRYITVYTEYVVDNTGNMVQNGSFTDNLDGYSIYVENNVGDANFTVVNETLEIEVTHIDEDKHYAPRISYGGMLFEQGAMYQVSFKAKADADRYIHVQVGELLSADPWYDDFTSGIEKLHLLTDNYQTYTFTFMMYDDTNYNGSILFEMGDLGAGNQLTTIYLDDIVITKLSESELLTVPGRIEAEDYTEMSGIVVEQTGDTDGVSNVGYFDPVDYVEYTINVLESGNYVIHNRLASDMTDRNMRMIMDNQLLYEITLPQTGGWQTYTTISTDSIYLEQGVHTFRITSTTGAININYLIFEKVN